MKPTTLKDITAAGSSVKTPKVTLLTHTHLPLETVYSIWEQSKGTAALRTPERIKAEVPPEEVEKLFKSVIAQRIPVGEAVSFTFALEHVSVSWREQAVRHRIGVEPSPERLGADIVAGSSLDVRDIPDRHKSSFWSQSMRIQDMSTFADNNDYRVPDTILNHPKAAGLLSMFTATMEAIQHTYRTLVSEGVPMEDARELIPLGAQHRITWTLNISALQHIVGERGCWILQLGLWGPVIQGMIIELAKIHPIFNELVTPPCLDGDTWKGCCYQEENRRRYTGEDAHPPCPLHITYHADEEQRQIMTAYAQPSRLLASQVEERARQYEKFWGRDPYSGKRLRVLAE